METQLFIRRKNATSKMEGPFTEAQFLEQIESRTIQFGDYAWRSGTNHWTLAGSLALALRPKAEPSGDQPPELVFQRGLATTEAGEREILLRMDRIRVFAHTPPECAEIALPLHLLLSSSSNNPGGKLWRRLATELTQLFASRVRYEQAGLLKPHPIRTLIGDRNLDSDLNDDEIALIACEELKRRAVLVGADLLVQFSVRFEFLVDASQPGRPAVPVVVASAMAGLTAQAAEARRSKNTAQPEPEAEAGTTSAASLQEIAKLKAQLAEMEQRHGSLEEREAFLIEAEARVMEKMEEQQVKEVELAHREDILLARTEAANRKG
jgi:hypothetical protein